MKLFVQKWKIKKKKSFAYKINNYVWQIGSLAKFITINIKYNNYTRILLLFQNYINYARTIVFLEQSNLALLIMY